MPVLTPPYRIGYRIAAGLIVGPGNLDAALLSPPAYLGADFFCPRLTGGSVVSGSRGLACVSCLRLLAACYAPLPSVVETTSLLRKLSIVESETPRPSVR
uniref:Uncharacterized protein n=1 Tax=Burkholderia sp. (strain CCGE1003) TaxID=640512 RepID=E1TB99_BURSG